MTTHAPPPQLCRIDELRPGTPRGGLIEVARDENAERPRLCVENVLQTGGNLVEAAHGDDLTQLKRATKIRARAVRTDSALRPCPAATGTTKRTRARTSRWMRRPTTKYLARCPDGVNPRPGPTMRRQPRPFARRASVQRRRRAPRLEPSRWQAPDGASWRAGRRHRARAQSRPPIRSVPAR